MVKKAGHKVIYLGQSVPFEDLVEVSGKHNIDYMLTSITTPLTRKKYTENIHQLSASFTKQIIFISGYQTHEHPIELPDNIKLTGHPTDFLAEIISNYKGHPVFTSIQ